MNHNLVTAQFILDEVDEKLTLKFKYARETAADAVDLFASFLEIVEPSAQENQVSRDADDDQILGTAVAGNADCIITGDKDLLVLKEFQGIDILTPRAFVDQEEISS